MLNCNTINARLWRVLNCLNLVGACYACNHTKGDVLMSKWVAFMEENLEWWKRFRGNRPYSNRGATYAETMEILKHGRAAKHPDFSAGSK